MNTLLQIRPTPSQLAATRLGRAYRWIKRARARARARRALAQIDARTLRDIGVTRRQVAVLVVTSVHR